MNEKWFALSVDEIEKKLKTNAASGLSRKAARSAWHSRAHSAKPLFLRRKKTVTKMLGETVADFSLIFLMLSAFFALLFDELYLGSVVLVICVLSLSLATLSYIRAQRTMEKMNMYFLPTAKVIRGGRLYRVTFENVVPGDVIILERGDVVPADARLVTSDRLSVSMRVDKKRFVHLKKQALGVVAENELDPKKLINILHAGSVIEEGSGRAIVYAVGQYTYLGAMTGGIFESYSDNVPTELKKMKKICLRTSLISMICILPFSIVSLLLSHMSGGTATLSVAFLTALAICSSTMTQFSCTLCKIFFVSKINDIAKSKNPIAIRTTNAFDRLADIDYLFLLDGASLTDGVLHFDGAFTCEGDVNSFDHITITVAKLFEMAALYDSVESSSLTLGVNLPDRFKLGLRELSEISNADVEALKIKYTVNSYMPGTATDPTDRVYYTENGRNMVLGISHSDEILSSCSYGVISGRIQQLNNVAVDRLRHTYNVKRMQGKTMLVFTLSSLADSGNKSGKLFLGAIVLGERSDSNAMSALAELEKNGIKPILFSANDTDIDIPQIPFGVQYGVKVTKDDLLNKGLPLTHNFGAFNTYYGLNEDDIYELMRFAHAQKKAVGIVGFSDFAAKAISEADVFISCAPLIDMYSAESEKELYELELAGEGSSKSCIPTVKAEADVILQRPDGKLGGISSLIDAFSTVESAYRNLNSFFKYLLCAQALRILTVAIPMAFGNPILDARHVLFFSFLIDIAILLTMAFDKSPIKRLKVKLFRISSLSKKITENKGLLISAIIGGISAIVLPMIADLIGVFGPYLYRVEYLFFAVLWLHLALAYYIRYSSVLSVAKIRKNKIFVITLVSVVVFAVLSILIAPFGMLFEMVSHPIAYFIMSFIPSVIFSVSCEIISHLKINK